MAGMMRRQRAILALTISALLGTIPLVPRAEAAIELDIVVAENGTKLGSTAFPAASGSSSDGVVFEMQAGTTVFVDDHITSVSWELDPTTWEVLSLTLAALSGDDPCNQPADGPCSNRRLALTKQAFEYSQTSCSGPFGTCTTLITIPVEIAFSAPAPAYACVGFEPPLADGPVTVKGNRALPLKAELVDQDGFMLTDADLGAAPVVQVVHHSGIAEPPEDVSDQALWAGQGSPGNAFVFSDGNWRFNLKIGNYTAPGTYVISMNSGDGAEYRIDPTCAVEFVVMP